ncbi:MAG: carboxypeptidase-like regulatory domain-containing protein [Acidobacteria bacterium]|nr:carboxypeptidase-like regulatory domain-containing protein [Acidobacteriota bacterium]
MERKRTPASFVPWAVVFLLMALVLPPSLYAQETRGKISGRVTDTSKAIIPGASVTATDVTRGSVASTTTNDQGLFQINYLLPGAYKVVVELSGFKKYVQDNVPVQANQTRDIGVVLEVGGVEETVSVTAEARTLNTTDGSLGLTVDQKLLESLPLIHGDPYKIMGLATGLALTGDPRLDRPFEPTHIIGYAFDGTRGNRSDLLIDGAPSTATANSGANANNAFTVIATYVPQSDMVQEFRVQTATFDSQFGNTEGGVTSMVIKSGTNSFHGTGYYFAEPSSLGANDVFGNARGQAKIESNSNRPGFTVGGPISIPGLYSGKDKTFFMVGYERITDKRPRFDIAGTSWVPTAALRNGDFSAYSSFITIYDPLTRAPTGTSGQYAGTAFSGNIIPTNRLNPIAQAILKYYTLPKNAGTNPATGPAGNASDATLAEETKPYDTLTGKIDHKFSANNRMFARYSWYERNSHYDNYLSSAASGTLFQFISKQAVIDDVHVFNATTVLNVRYGYNRFDRNSDMELPEAIGFDLTKIGFPAQYNTMVPEVIRRFPRLDFTSGDMVSVAYGNDFRPVTSHTFAATLNKSMGAHAVKGGAEIRLYTERSLPTGNAQSGQYAFSNTYTRQNSASGTDYQGLQAFATFLLGMPSTTSISVLPSFSEYSITSGFFVQDDWRVNNKLTVNLGLRYEVESPMAERQNASVSNFDASYVQPLQAAAQANYAALNDAALKALVPQLNVKGGLMFAGVDGGSALYTTPKNTFLPRFGLAYQLDDKTVIRAGVGLFAGFLGQRRGDIINYGYSQTTTVGTTTDAFGAPIPQYWDNAFVTTPPITPVGNALGRQTFLGNAISFFNQNPKVSKQLRGQIGVQRELPGGMTLEAAFVSNYGYDIEITRNINALPTQYLSTDNSRTAAMVANNTFLTAAVTNPFAGLLPGTSFNNATISRSQLLLPYPEFGAINTTNNDGKSWYNAGQFGLQKRFAGGYSVGVSYTRSKWMQATEYLNAADPRPTKMISDLDVTNRLTVTGIFAFPFGKGRHFLSGANGILEAIVGGWQVQGNYTFQTGFPISFSDAFYNGTDPVNGSDIKITNQTTKQWFNTAPFTSILTDTSTNATPVNHLRTLPLRFTNVRCDAINNLDLSLIKDIRLGGDVRLQLRAEFINALNTPYLAAAARSAPVTSPTNAAFGQVTNSNQANYARRAQVGVKILF